MVVNLKDQGQIHIVKDPSEAEKFSKQYNLGKGEASVITAAGWGDDIVLTDDIKSPVRCEDYKEGIETLGEAF